MQEDDPPMSAPEKENPALDRRRERGWLHLRRRRGRYFGTATVK
jgi:hypothetical protein